MSWLEIFSNLLKICSRFLGGHHLFLIDKCSNDAIKAYYYVRQTVENAWSRAMLENFYDTNLFERGQ